MKKYKILYSITLDFLTPQDQVTCWFDDGTIEYDGKNTIWYISPDGEKRETINTIGLINLYIRDRLVEEIKEKHE